MLSSGRMFERIFITYLRPAIRAPLLRHALFALFIAGVLAYGAGFAAYMLAHFDLISLIRDASNDDAFYYFQIAYHLADGKFSTFDGGITRTNGYHPIWMFAITPFYWVFDKETALFGIKAFEIMLVAGAVACIAGAARLARLPWVLLFAALPLLYQNRQMLSGMEAAAALFMLGLFMLALMLYARNPARWTWPLAAVAFALPWVRLEYIAISLAATVALCVVEWSWRERPAGASWRGLILSTPPPRTLVLIGSAVAGILAYLLYNGLVFGGIVPVSGATKAAWWQFEWEQAGGYSFTQNFRDALQVPVFDFELLIALAVCAGLLPVWWLARRSRDERDWLLLAFLVGVFGLAAGHLAMFAHRVLTVHPYAGVWPHYFVPAYLMMALIVPVSCYAGIYFIRRCIGPRWRRTANLLGVGIVAAGAVFLLTQADFAGPFRDVDAHSERVPAYSSRISFYAGTLAANRLLTDGSVIGSWDAGIIGYFSRFPVVNLDGLVNSYDYFRATNPTADSYAAWQDGKFKPLYRELGISHLANRSKNIKHTFDSNVFESRAFVEIWPNWDFRLGSVAPSQDADTAARLWQRLEPHFAHQLDGIGLIVDGRLAQAFAKDCAPGELIIWSWAEPERATAAKFVMSLHRSQSGICGDAIALPRNMGHPVQVEKLVEHSSPAIRANFDVHLIGNQLIYVKEQCRPDDLAATFFLHVSPLDASDLPDQRQQHGFDNRDFTSNRIIRLGSRCYAEIPLPQYDITEIRTGQYIRMNGGYKHVWEGEFPFAPGQ